MSFYLTYKNSIQNIKQNKLDYLFLFFQFVVLSDLVVHFLADSFLVINFTISLCLVLLKKRFNVYELLIFITVFILIALVPIIVWGFDTELYIGYILRITTALLIIQYYRGSFFIYYENLMFILASIALLFFVVQQLLPHLFNLMSPVSKLLLAYENYALGRQYFLIFFFRPGLEFRNCGFMWEPAAFSGVLTWAILFNLYINKFEINKKLVILTLAGITTFSIGFFAYLFFIFALYFLQKNKKALKYLILALPVLYAAQYLPVVQENIAIIENKIQLEESQNISNAQNLSVDKGSYSRIGGFIVNSKYFAQWPLGYGLIDQNNAPEALQYLGASPNALAKILVQWGIIGLLIIILSIRKSVLFLINLYYPKVKFWGIVITIIIILGPFIGNPFSRQPLTFAILLIGLFLNKRYSLHV